MHVLRLSSCTRHNTHTNPAPFWFRVRIFATHTRCAAAPLHAILNPWLASNQPIDQPGDTSDGLEVSGTDALQLNGASIQRVSTYPSQSADLTIGSGGSDGSSSDGSDGGTSGLYGFSLRGSGGVADISVAAADSPPVVIDCSETPVILGVMATAFAGEYGAGQRIYFQVR